MQNLINKSFEKKDIINEKSWKKIYPNYNQQKELSICKIINESNEFQKLKNSLIKIKENIKYKEYYAKKNILGDRMGACGFGAFILSVFFICGTLMINYYDRHEETKKEYISTLNFIEKYKRNNNKSIEELSNDNLLISNEKYAENLKAQIDRYEAADKNKNKLLFLMIGSISALLLIDRFGSICVVIVSRRELVILNKEKRELVEKMLEKQHNYEYYVKPLLNGSPHKILSDILIMNYMSNYGMLNRLNKQTIDAKYCSHTNIVINENINNNHIFNIIGNEHIKEIEENTRIFKKTI